MFILLLSMLATNPSSSLPDAPDTGVDLDITSTIESAQKKLAKNDPNADQEILELHLSTDRFTRAQAKKLSEQSAAMLQQTAHLRMAKHEFELGTRDLYAAWQLRGKPQDSELSTALTQWSQQLKTQRPAEALYLARQAVELNPQNATAVRLDQYLSTNPNRAVGFTLVGAGAAALISGLVLAIVSTSTKKQIESGVTTRSRADWDALISTNKTTAWASAFSFIGSGVLALTGAGVLWAGQRNEPPRTPTLLPALSEGVK